MCGIIGTIPSSPLSLDYLFHRGPDDRGIVKLPDITLGHVRLSILELSKKGAQPMQSQDGNVWLSYNGEIYNYQDLSSNKETCDTKVLVNLLAKNKSSVNMSVFDGMYAFAAYFNKEQELMLCRDPAGIKPLYLALHSSGDYLAFCSEIKGFFSIPWFECLPNPNPEIQKDFLQYGFTYPQITNLVFKKNNYPIRLIPTLITGVYQLCPGQKLIIGNNDIKSEFTHLPPCRKDPISLLKSSVRAQSMSDVEVGVQLSGGIDSSLVTYEYALQNKSVWGFNLSIDNFRFNEDKWVEIVTKKLQKVTDFKLHQIKLTRDVFSRSLSKALWYMDEPLIRQTNAIGIFVLCEYVRKSTPVKVLLTGEGADEIFGGYSWQNGKTMDGYDSLRRIFNLGGSELVTQLINETPGQSVFDRQLNYDLNYYLPQLLLRQDKMSMASSIESRVPFLANSFLGLPHPKQAGKEILKTYAASVFGNDFAYRPKNGFGFPDSWYSDHAPDYRYLDWLRLKPKPKTNLQIWSLSNLSYWSKLYFHQKRMSKLHFIHKNNLANKISRTIEDSVVAEKLFNFYNKYRTWKNYQFYKPNP